MKKLERNLNKISVIIGITMITTVIMAMSSCICGGQKEPCCETVEERKNCDQGCEWNL